VGLKPVKNVKGWPRPTHQLNGKNAPIPWVGGDNPEMGEWAAFSLQRKYEATSENLCIMCGLDKGHNYVYALIHGEEYSDGGFTLPPTWGHPHCILLACLYCPHLQQFEYPACDKNGHKLTIEDLKDLADKSRPKHKQ